MHKEVVMYDGNKIITFLDSAIMFYNSKEEVYQVETGKRHCDIIKKIAEKGLTKDYKKNHTDGFFCKVVWKDNKHHPIQHFISREQSTRIAKENNYSMIGSILTSEDLW